MVLIVSPLKPPRMCFTLHPHEVGGKILPYFKNVDITKPIFQLLVSTIFLDSDVHSLKLGCLEDHPKEPRIVNRTCWFFLPFREVVVKK